MSVFNKQMLKEHLHSAEFIFATWARAKPCFVCSV